MSKALFRYLRGELNGFYINAIHNSLNESISEIEMFFHSFQSMQFTEKKMDEDTVYNLGKFAGVFLPRLKAGEGGYGSMRMTSSKIVGSVERSERGLLERDSDAFTFVHTTMDDYETDINTESNINKKSSLVGSEQLKGYIPSTANNVVTDEGNINERAVSTSVPQGVAYSDYYGNNFLYVVDSVTQTLRNLDVSIFIPLFKVMQYVRYNGQNIESLCKIISILCPNGFVKIASIEKNENALFFEVNYVIDDSVDLTLKTQRLASLLYVVGLKFPQFTMTEV